VRSSEEEAIMHQGNPRRGVTRNGIVAQLVIGLACLIGSCTSVFAFPITIDPGAYTGRYFIVIDGTWKQYTGRTVVELSVNRHCIDTGAFAGPSGFCFTVDAAGQVTSVSPSAAAAGVGSTLRFANVSITIDPRQYTGRYFLSSHYGIPPYTPFTGLQTVVLIPALGYWVDTGAFVGSSLASSGFSFTLDAAGQVTSVSPSAAAAGVGSTLRFANVGITIDPGGYTGEYYLSSHYGIPPYTPFTGL
jgi:hypothetical protein